MSRRLDCRLLLAGAILLTGCSRPPAAQVYNDHLLDAMIAAVATKDSRALDQYANRARSCRQMGCLSDAEYKQLGAIAAKGRAGDWPGAAAAGNAAVKQRQLAGSSD